MDNNSQNAFANKEKIPKQGEYSVIFRNLFFTALEKMRRLWYNKLKINLGVYYGKNDSGYAYAL